MEAHLTSNDLIDFLDNEGIAKEKKEEVMTVVAEHYSGVLPHPDHLKQYSEIGNNVVETILSMAVENQLSEINARQSSNDYQHKVLSYNARDNLLGAIFAFILLLLLLALGALMIYKNYNWAGYGFSITGIFGTISLFLKRQDENSSNTIKKTNDDS